MQITMLLIRVLHATLQGSNKSKKSNATKAKSRKNKSLKLKVNSTKSVSSGSTKKSKFKEYAKSLTVFFLELALCLQIRRKISRN